MKWIKYTLLVMVSLLIANNAEAIQRNIEPSASSIIAPESYDDSTLGQRILIKFDMPEDISGKNVTRAHIKFRYNFPTFGSESSIAFKIYPITSIWESNQPDWDDWDNAGGDFTNSVGYSYAFELGENTNLNIDVTDMVQLMVENELTNHGFILIPADFHGNAYRSINVENFDISELIRLEILYR